MDLYSGSFQGLGNLTTLELCRLKLSVLQIGVFKDLTNLITLNISNNTVTVLPAGRFEVLTNLKTLLLSTNPLFAIANTSLNGLGQLETLDLSFIAYYGRLSADMFYDLTNLKNFYASGVIHIENLNADVFKHTPDLMIVFLLQSNFNTLSGTCKLFVGLNKLETLNLDNNLLKTLPYNLFYGLVSLIYLGLASNRLKELDSGVF